MRDLLSILALVACTLTPAAEAQNAIPPLVDEAFASYAALPSKLVPVLSKVKDKESADTAAPALFALLPEVYDTRTALHRIGEMGRAETQLVQQKYETQLRREWGKLFEQIYRLQKTQCYGSQELFKQFQILCLMLEK